MSPVFRKQLPAADSSCSELSSLCMFSLKKLFLLLRSGLSNKLAGQIFAIMPPIMRTVPLQPNVGSSKSNNSGKMIRLAANELCTNPAAAGYFLEKYSPIMPIDGDPISPKPKPGL